MQQHYTFVNSTFEDMSSSYKYEEDEYEDHKEKLKQLQTKFTYLKEPKKRTRTTPEQLTTLMRFFEKEPSPTPKQRRALAKKTGMTARTVQVWFQNRRAKYKVPSAVATSSSDCGLAAPSSSSPSPSPAPSSPSEDSSTFSSTSSDSEDFGLEGIEAEYAEFQIKESFGKQQQPQLSCCQGFEASNNEFIPQESFTDFLNYRCADDPFIFTPVDFDIASF
jgi:hypothetical protein